MVETWVKNEEKKNLHDTWSGGETKKRDGNFLQPTAREGRVGLEGVEGCAAKESRKEKKKTLRRQPKALGVQKLTIKICSKKNNFQQGWTSLKLCRKS